MTDLSNAGFTAPPQQILPVYSSQNLPLVSSTAASQLNQNGPGSMLVYPNDNSKYCITFSIQQYQRPSIVAGGIQSIQQVGQFVPSGFPGIVMPFPTQLIDDNIGRWAETEGGVIQALQSALTFAGGVARPTGGGGGGQGAQAVAGLTEAATRIAAGQYGVVPNQFVTMLYHGPTFKRFTIQWQLSPQNFKEADTLRMIDLCFKNAMSPWQADFGVQGALWAFPCIFRLRIYPNSKWLMKFKPMVLEHWQTNYTPTGQGSFHRNANGVEGDNPPEGINIEARFIELEYWQNGQFSSTNDPDDADRTPVQGTVFQSSGAVYDALPSGTIVSSSPSNGKINQ
jgi:hypothetical protein